MIILVTGATAGFGESITRRFVANGHKVIATGRRQERLQELKDELGDSILTAQLDVRTRAAIEEMIANLPAEWREIDVLVNNAGLALGMEPAHKASVEDWENMIDTNNKGLVYMTRAVLPGMVEQRFHRRKLALRGRQRLWRDQSLCPPVQPEPAHRPARNRDPRDRC